MDSKTEKEETKPDKETTKDDDKKSDKEESKGDKDGEKKDKKEENDKAKDPIPNVEVKSNESNVGVCNYQFSNASNLTQFWDVTDIYNDLITKLTDKSLGITVSCMRTVYIFSFIVAFFNIFFML